MLANEKVAIQIEKELQEEHKKIIELDHEQNQCLICYEHLTNEGDDVVFFEGCNHVWHKQCIKQTIQTQLTSMGQLEYRCPAPNCGAIIAQATLREVLDQAEFEKYNDLKLKEAVDKADNLTWCPTPGCEQVFDRNGISEYKCYSCKKHYCLDCKSEWHQGKTCTEHKAEMINNNHQPQDDQFLEFVQQNKFKQCPQCKFWVEKKAGCDFMTCRCRYQFCYKCGSNYRACACYKR